MKINESSSLLIFEHYFVEKVKKESLKILIKEKKDENLSITQQAAILGKEWKKLTKEGKSPYFDLYKLEKNIYEEEKNKLLSINY